MINTRSDHYSPATKHKLLANVYEKHGELIAKYSKVFKGKLPSRTLLNITDSALGHLIAFAYSSIRDMFKDYSADKSSAMYFIRKYKLYLLISSDRLAELSKLISSVQFEQIVPADVPQTLVVYCTYGFYDSNRELINREFKDAFVVQSTTNTTDGCKFIIYINQTYSNLAHSLQSFDNIISQSKHTDGLFHRIPIVVEGINVTFVPVTQTHIEQKISICSPGLVFTELMYDNEKVDEVGEAEDDTNSEYHSDCEECVMVAKMYAEMEAEEAEFNDKDWIRKNPPTNRLPTTEYFRQYKDAGGMLNPNNFGKLMKSLGYQNVHSNGKRWYEKK